MTPRALAFVEAFIADPRHDPVAATIRAGYSSNRARAITWRLLRTSSVQAAARVLARDDLRPGTRAAIEAALSGIPVYTPLPRKPRPSAAERRARLEAIVAAATEARAERRRRRDRSPPMR